MEINRLHIKEKLNIIRFLDYKGILIGIVKVLWRERKD
jgi:hypothetical protein